MLFVELALIRWTGLERRLPVVLLELRPARQLPRHRDRLPARRAPRATSSRYAPGRAGAARRRSCSSSRSRSTRRRATSSSSASSEPTGPPRWLTLAVDLPRRRGGDGAASPRAWPARSSRSSRSRPTGSTSSAASSASSAFSVLVVPAAAAARLGAWSSRSSSSCCSADGRAARSLAGGARRRSWSCSAVESVAAGHAAGRRTTRSRDRRHGRPGHVRRSSVNGIPHQAMTSLAVARAQSRSTSSRTSAPVGVAGRRADHRRRQRQRRGDRARAGAPATSTRSRSTRGCSELGARAPPRPALRRPARRRAHRRRPRVPRAHRPSSYDLILFALPDSLTLVSGQSSLRLESYLFTREAIEAARDHLSAGRRVRDVQLLPRAVARSTGSPARSTRCSGGRRAWTLSAAGGPARGARPSSRDRGSRALRQRWAATADARRRPGHRRPPVPYLRERGHPGLLPR